MYAGNFKTDRFHVLLFFSREHEPIHVHIEGADGYAVYDLRKDRFVQRTVSNIKAGDLKKIEMVLDENKEMIIQLGIVILIT